MKPLMSLLLLTALGGCGVGETAATAGAVGAGKAREGEQAGQTLQRAEQRLDAAQQQAMDRLKHAEQ